VARSQNFVRLSLGSSSCGPQGCPRRCARFTASVIYRNCASRIVRELDRCWRMRSRPSARLYPTSVSAMAQQSSRIESLGIWWLRLTCTGAVNRKVCAGSCTDRSRLFSESSSARDPAPASTPPVGGSTSRDRPDAHGRRRGRRVATDRRGGKSVRCPSPDGSAPGDNARRIREPPAVTSSRRIE
jgi:hypothetical protein